MDVRFPTPISRLVADVEAPAAASPLAGLADWLARLPLGAGSRRRQAMRARRGREAEAAPRRPRSRRLPEAAPLPAVEDLFGAMPQGWAEVRSAMPEQLPVRDVGLPPGWVTGGEGLGRLGRDEGETGAFLQLFARNVDSLTELSRTL